MPDHQKPVQPRGIVLQLKPNRSLRKGPSVTKLATMPNEVRIHAVQEEKWIDYAAARKILRRLLLSVKLSNKQSSMLCLVCGPARNGKSSLVRQLVVELAASVKDAASSRVALHLDMPSDGCAKSLYDELARRLHIGAGRSTPRIRTEVLDELRDRKPEIILIEQAEHIGWSSKRQQAVLLAAIREVARESGAAVILVGKSEAGQTLAAHPDWRARFAVQELPLWRQETSFADMLTALEAGLPLRTTSHLTEPGLAAALYSASGGTIGGLTDTIRKAATAAILEGDERITIDLLQRHSWLPAPSASSQTPGGSEVSQD